MPNGSNGSISIGGQITSATRKERVSVRVLSDWQQVLLMLLLLLIWASIIGGVTCGVIVVAAHTLPDATERYLYLGVFASVLIGLVSAALVASIGKKKRVSPLFPSDQLFSEIVDDRISLEQQPTVARPSDQLIHLTGEGIYVRLSPGFFFRRWHWFVPWRSVSSCRYSDEGGYVEPVIRKHTILKMTPNRNFAELKDIVMTHIGTSVPKEEAKVFCPRCGAANPDERESCTSCGSPLQIQKRRHGFVTVWLVLMIITNSVMAIIYIWDCVVAEDWASWASLLGGQYVGTPWWVFLILFIAAAINARCAAALLDWRKWGFYGIAAVTLVDIIANVAAGGGFLLVIIQLAYLAIFFGILHIGKEEKVWPQLE